MNIYRISEFMQLGGQTVPADVDREISTEELLKFWERIDDELQETWEAICYWNSQWEMYEPHLDEPPRDFPEVVDGFLDIAFCALSAAIRVAGETKAYKAWWEVVQANLFKVNGMYGPKILNPDTGKIEKPEGWVAPDIERILNG